MDLSDRSTRMRVNKRFREQGDPLKVCGRCFVVKGHGGFDVATSSPDGRQNWCALCRAQWRDANREHRAAYDKQWSADRRARTAARRHQEITSKREAGVKPCTKCGLVKQFDDFNKAETGLHGLRGDCKDCQAAAGRARYAADPSQRKASSRAWYAENRQSVYARTRVWHAANRDVVNESSRKWRERNPLKVRGYAHARRALITGATAEDFTARDLRHDWEDHDLYDCFFCGGTLADGYEVEHFYPLSKGGPHALWNLLPSCMPCNRGVGGKGTKEPWSYLRESLAEQGTDLDAAIAGLEAIAARRRR